MGSETKADIYRVAPELVEGEAAVCGHSSRRSYCKLPTPKPRSVQKLLHHRKDKQSCELSSLHHVADRTNPVLFVHQDRIAEGAVSGKVSVGRREVMIAWLRLACGWTIAAAEVCHHSSEPVLAWAPPCFIVEF